MNAVDTCSSAQAMSLPHFGNMVSIPRTIAVEVSLNASLSGDRCDTAPLSKAMRRALTHLTGLVGAAKLAKASGLNEQTLDRAEKGEPVRATTRKLVSLLCVENRRILAKAPCRHCSIHCEGTPTQNIGCGDRTEPPRSVIVSTSGNAEVIESFLQGVQVLAENHGLHLETA